MVLERRMSLFSLVVVAVLSLADAATATLLPDGEVVWAFEGTATSINGVQDVVGSLLFSPASTIDLHAMVGGIDEVSGSFFSVSLIDRPPGHSDEITTSGGSYNNFSTVTSPYGAPISNSGPPLYYTVEPAYMSIDLKDKDGSLFDDAVPPLPPVHAPDIDVFQIAQLSILQQTCFIATPSPTLECYTAHLLDVQFTSFSDPVPEPDWLTWMSLASLCSAIGLRVRA
jgi:hypothetical protein